MDIVKGYKRDEKLCRSLFGLAKSTFGIDLDKWSSLGFWQDDYIPYSFVDDGKVLVNVSVSVCNIRWKGRVRHLAQIGTVMCDPAVSGQGYTGELIKEVLADCERSYEGVYLYAKEQMASFYEKFGFGRQTEYRCSKKVNITHSANVEKISMDIKEDQQRLVDIILRRGHYGERIMVNNPGLYMFHMTQEMSDGVYYLPSCESYAVADVENSELMLHAVFTSEKISLGDVISSFGKDIERITLTFTPENKTGFDIKAINDPDDCLFVRGDIFENMKNERSMFPLISHS